MNIEALVEKYWAKEKYPFPRHFEHRYDPDSSAILYSLIRELKPVSCLEIGTWLGGTTLVIMKALLKNEQPFSFVASELLQNNRARTGVNVLQETGRTPTMIGDITENLAHVPKTLDLLVIDTNHDLETTEWYVKNIFPRCKKGALVAIHDWAVQEIDDKWVGKGDEGIGGTPETQYLMDLHEKGILPLKKLHWNYKGPGGWEASYWTYKPL